MSSGSFYKLATVLVMGLGPLWAQSASDDFQVGLGIQAFDVSGNYARYRSQVNERDGFVLDQFTWQHYPEAKPKRYLDRLRLDASGFGGRPNGHLFLKAGLANLYRLNFSFLKANYFSDIPGWATFSNQAASPSLHSIDRDRENWLLDIDFLPNRQWRPFFSYQKNRYSGPGLTTLQVGEDEFRLRSQLKDSEDTIQLGLNWHLASFHGKFSQGYRVFRGRENTELDENAEQGFLPDSQIITQLSGQRRTKTQTPVTTASMSGALSKRFDILTTFSYADQETESSENEQLQGHLVLRSFQERLIFSGRETLTETSAKNPNWRGHVRIQARLPHQIKARLGWTQNRRQVSGSGLISTLFLDAISFGELETRDLERLAQINNLMERKERTLDSEFVWRFHSNWRTWVGTQWSRLNVISDAALAQIVIPGSNQEGEFDREVFQYNTGIAYAKKKNRVSLRWTQAESDRPIVRTDFQDRRRLKLRAKFAKGHFLLNGYLLWMNYQNNQEQVGLDGRQWHGVMDLGYRFRKNLRWGGTFGMFNYDHKTTIKNPNDLIPQRAQYREDGTELRTYIDWTRGKAHFNLAAAQYQNRGVLPYRWLQSSFQADWEWSTNFKLKGVLQFRDYAEPQLPGIGFETLGFGLYFQWVK